MNVSYAVESVTPKMAEKWLKEHNTKNRPLFEKTIDRYARDMASGAWTVTNQGIGFAEDGTLLDGQQRLSAIVKAGVPIKMLVVRNLPAIYKNNGDGKLFTQDVIDGGKPRTISDVLAISHGVTDATYKVAIANMIVYSLKGVVKLSPRVALKIIDLYSDEIEFTLSDRSSVRGLSYTPAMTGIILAAKVDLDKAMDFKQRYFKGTNLYEGDPALTFRTFMLGRKTRGTAAGGERATVLNYCMTAIKYHFDGKPLKRMVASDAAKEWFFGKQKSHLSMISEWLVI